MRTHGHREGSTYTGVWGVSRRGTVVGREVGEQ